MEDSAYIYCRVFLNLWQSCSWIKVVCDRKVFLCQSKTSCLYYFIWFNSFDLLENINNLNLIQIRSGWGCFCAVFMLLIWIFETFTHIFLLNLWQYLCLRPTLDVLSLGLPKSGSFYKMNNKFQVRQSAHTAFNMF